MFFFSEEKLSNKLVMREVEPNINFTALSDYLFRNICILWSPDTDTFFYPSEDMKVWFIVKTNAIFVNVFDINFNSVQNLDCEFCTSWSIKQGLNNLSFISMQSKTLWRILTTVICSIYSSRGSLRVYCLGLRWYDCWSCSAIPSFRRALTLLGTSESATCSQNFSYHHFIAFTSGYIASITT